MVEFQGVPFYIFYRHLQSLLLVVCMACRAWYDQIQHGYAYVFLRELQQYYSYVAL